MNINPVQTGTASPLANTSNNGSAAAGSSGSDPLTDSDSMFMQLLTAQLENQSPLDPVDPSQFTDQLVELNMLDQLSQINQTLQTAFPSSGSSSNSSSSSNSAVQGVL